MAIHTCSPAVPLHLQLVASLGVSHAELVIDSIGCLPVVLQVHPQLVLPLGCDFVQVVQPCRRQAKVDAEAPATEAIISTPLASGQRLMCVKEGQVLDPGLQLGLLLAGATPTRQKR